MTNREWLNTLTDEEMAEVLYGWGFKALFDWLRAEHDWFKA